MTQIHHKRIHFSDIWCYREIERQKHFQRIEKRPLPLWTSHIFHCRIFGSLRRVLSPDDRLLVLLKRQSRNQVGRIDQKYFDKRSLNDLNVLRRVINVVSLRPYPNLNIKSALKSPLNSPHCLNWFFLSNLNTA